MSNLSIKIYLKSGQIINSYCPEDEWQDLYDDFEKQSGFIGLYNVVLLANQISAIEWSNK
jgi:hypothetical protein